MDDLCTCGGPNGCMIHKERLAVVELTKEECSVVEDLRLAAEGFSSDHEMTITAVADKIEAAEIKAFFR